MAAADIIVLACLLGVVLVAWSVRQRGSARHSAEDNTKEEVAVFLFRNSRLRDVTACAGGFLPTGGGSTVDDLVTSLSGAFPDLAVTALTAADCVMTSADSRSSLSAESSGDMLRVTVRGLHHIAMARDRQSISLLDDIATHSPQLVWQQDSNGQVVWSNRAVRRLVDEIGPQEGVLFPDLDHRANLTDVRLQPAGCTDRWFDVTTAPRDDGRLTCFATETTALVRADENRRDYIKTLGRTFGDLSTGLAIFDGNRQLKMFNPALLEMSRLPFAFLSTRPRIDAVFDRMRELQMMPEPKDYLSWREQFTAVEAGAKQGTYCENWPLPDGQTFRVTGRPHPDGAFALLFEDITAEISLTRRFRTEIETGQAVLDSLPDAVAVFSPTGTVVMRNAAYGALWGDDGHHFTHRDIGTELALWRENAVTSAIWADIRAIAQRETERKPWSGDTLLLDGRPLRCHATPLDGGMTLVRFALAPAVRPIIQKLTQHDPAIRVRGR